MSSREPASCPSRIGPVGLAVVSGRASTAKLSGSKARLALSNTTFVVSLYQDVLLRNPAPAELQGWVGQLNAGRINRIGVASAFWGSTEHRGVQVDQLYRSFLGRPSDAQGRDANVNALLRGANLTDVEIGFINSAEYQSAHLSDPDYVDGLYGDVLNRLPDDPGRAAQLSALTSGTSRSSLASAIVESDEGYLIEVDRLYADLLHRLGDERGLQYFGSLVADGTYWLDDVAASLLASNEYEQVHANIPT